MSGNLGDYHRYQRFPVYPRRSGGRSGTGGPNRRARRRSPEGRQRAALSGWRGWVRRHLLAWLGDERYRRRRS